MEILARIIKRGRGGVAILALTAVVGVTTYGDPADFAKDVKKSKTKDQMELTDVIRAIEDALTESQEHPVPGFPPLKKVKVTLQTTVSKDAGGTLKIFVLSFGGKKSTGGVSSLIFELKPPDEKVKTGVSSVKPEDIRNAVARLIQSAKIGFLSAQQSSKTLKTNTINISVGFTVKTERIGGVDTGELLPIGITASGNLSSASANTIELEFSMN